MYKTCSECRATVCQSTPCDVRHTSRATSRKILGGFDKLGEGRDHAVHRGRRHAKIGASLMSITDMTSPFLHDPDPLEETRQARASKETSKITPVDSLQQGCSLKR
jgi:hypothetical protein